MNIRKERKKEEEEISKVKEEDFRNVDYRKKKEGEIVDEIREEKEIKM